MESTNTLQHRIELQPDFSLLTLRLAPGQRVFAEPGAMATMDTTIDMSAGLRGGMLRSLGRAFGGESLFMSSYTAARGTGEVTFAPGPMGDIRHYRLTGGAGLMLQRSAHLAHSDGVEVTGSWQGARGFFSGEGLVLLKASGQGDLFFNTYGGLVEVDVDGGFVVDTGYVAAFESTLGYRVGVLSGMNLSGQVKSFIFGGEALVCHFSGTGRLWVQTRAVREFLRWVWPYRPQKRRD